MSQKIGQATAGRTKGRGFKRPYSFWEFEHNGKTYYAPRTSAPGGSVEDDIMIDMKTGEVFMHKQKNVPRSSAVNKDAAEKLFIFIENDADLYRQRFIPIVHNLQKKIDKGTFDAEKSLTLWMYLVEDGAKKLQKQFEKDENAGYQVPDFARRKWSDTFSKPTRLVVAKELASKFITEINLGNRW